jgi:molybdopterin/thiamine biosynthesis adenylyltransferase
MAGIQLPEEPVRIKQIYPVYRTGDRTFRIGAQLGITAEFDDPDEQVWTLVHLLDGRGYAEVIAQMRTRYPKLSAQDVLDGINILDAEGFLERVAPDGRQEADVEARLLPTIRYFSRFSSVEGNRYAAQDALQNAKVLLLGLGGGGSNFLTLLSGVGFGHIVAVDHDNVEEGNLGRQFLYREADIGTPKAIAAAAAIGEMNSLCTVEPHVRRIDSAGDVLDLMDGVDLVVCAIDEPPFVAQRRVNAACVANDVPCVYGVSMVSRGRVFTVWPGRSGCFDCLNISYSKKDPQFVRQFRGFQTTDFRAPSIAYAPGMFHLSAVVVDEAVRVVTGYAPLLALGVQFEVDYETASSSQLLEWSRFPEDCPTCGTGDEANWEIFANYHADRQPAGV